MEFAIPILIFLGVFVFIKIFGSSAKESKDKHKQQPPIAPRNEGSSANQTGYYNLADEIRQKTGKQSKPVATKPIAKKSQETKAGLAANKVTATIKPSGIRPTVLAKYSFEKLQPSKLQTVSKSQISVIEEATGSNISPLYQRLAYSDDITEEGNKAVLEAMVLGEVLYKPKWKERYRI